MTCVLCGSKSTRSLQTIPISDIAAVYRRFLDLDVEYLFTVDTLDYLSCEECGVLFFSPPIPGDESFYNSLQRYDWYYADEKDEFVFAADWVRSDNRVLEIGCGKGAFANHIRCASYEGVDLSDNAVCMAKEAGLCVSHTTIEAFAENKAGSFDVVCAFQTLEHVIDPGTFLQAATSCLAPGGRLILSVPSQSSFVGETCNAVLNLPPHHLSRWTDDALKSIGRLFDLSVLSLAHLPLDPSHREWFAMTRIMSQLRKLPGVNRRAVVDNSMWFWTLYATARFLARHTLAAPSHQNPPDGHTVLAVFEKEKV
ncbi:MAG: class I SAM-dependent methyltransferase [Pseudodesulfovibrio sp.]